MPDTKLIARMSDLIGQASQNGTAHSKFLTSAEVDEVQRAFQSRRDISLIFDGGFQDAERCIAVFVNPDWGEYRHDDFLAALSIKIRRQDTVSHRDILGAVLGLGIERSLLGDIVIGETSYLICLTDIAGFICENLKKAGRVGLRTEQLPLSALPEVTHRIEERTDTVASLRLDVIVAVMFNLSRGKAAELIGQGRVQLAHRLCEDTAKSVAPGDIISVRGMGRGRLLELGGQSKKGRTWIRFGVYE